MSEPRCYCSNGKSAHEPRVCKDVTLPPLALHLCCGGVFTPALALDDYDAWHDRAVRDAPQCPSCQTSPGAHHFIPCPLDRGVWPCLEWKEQPGPGGAGKCECGATSDQHAVHRQDRTTMRYYPAFAPCGKCGKNAGPSPYIAVHGPVFDETAVRCPSCSGDASAS